MHAKVTKSAILLLLLFILAGCRPELTFPTPSETAHQSSPTPAQLKSDKVVKLAEKLCKEAGSQDEKAREFFAYLAENMVLDPAGADASQSPGVVLREQRGTSEGISQLYKALCDEVGLECRVIEGKVKSFSGQLEEPRYWNSVKLKDGWRYLDVAQALEAEDNQREMWFGVQARALKYTHHWAESKSNLTAFQNSPRFLPNFTEMGLTLGSKSSSEKGRFSLEIGRPDDISIEATLVGVGGTEHDNACLVEQRDGSATINVSFPSEGDFQLRLWALPQGHSSALFVGSLVLKSHSKPLKVVLHNPTPLPPTSTPGPDQSPTPRPKSPPATFQPVPGISEEIQKKTFEITRNLGSDKEKAHAIYRYLTENIAYDTDSYFNLPSNRYPDQKAEAVFQRQNAVCAGYSRLFDAMATSAGLESEYVGGIIKTSPSTPVEKRLHAWNAIKLDGQWHLLDSTWGAGSVDTKTQSFESNPNDDWFLLPPEQFRFTHLPDDANWLLTSSSLTRSEFERLPKLRPLYFRHGLKLKDEKLGRFEVAGELTLQLESRKGMLVSAQLRQNDIEIPNCATAIQVGKDVTIKARFPKPGSYQVILFAREPKQTTASSVAEFFVESSTGTDQLLPDYRPRFSEYKLKLEEPDKGLYQFDRELSLRVNRPSPNIKLSATVVDQNDQTIQNMAMVNTISGGQVEVRAHCPQPGRYQLNLFAANVGEKNLGHVVSVQLHAKQGGKEFPLLYSDFAKNQGELLEGKAGEIRAGSRERIKLRFPSLSNLYLKQGNDYQEFSKDEDTFKMEFTPQSGEAVVAYRDGSKYRFIMKYQVR